MLSKCRFSHFPDRFLLTELNPGKDLMSYLHLHFPARLLKARPATYQPPFNDRP